eukprot:1282733-Rhodomonas_salina.2
MSRKEDLAPGRSERMSAAQDLEEFGGDRYVPVFEPVKHRDVTRDAATSLPYPAFIENVDARHWHDRDHRQPYYPLPYAEENSGSEYARHRYNRGDPLLKPSMETHGEGLNDRQVAYWELGMEWKLAEMNRQVEDIEDEEATYGKKMLQTAPALNNSEPDLFRNTVLDVALLLLMALVLALLLYFCCLCLRWKKPQRKVVVFDGDVSGGRRHTVKVSRSSATQTASTVNSFPKTLG